MVKKKFIDKRAATTFSVVHRSQQDGAFGIEDRPSERVLLAHKRVAPHAVKKAMRGGVNELGFAEDGYDYERHLRTVGGGTFVGADGSVGATPALPAEALPASDEIEREVEAVTLDPSLMDVEVAEALFDDAAFEDCEELLDDFVVDAAAAPEGEEAPFDYDAHIARLIANAGGGHLHDSEEEEEDDDEDDWASDAEATADAGGGGDVDAAFEAALADYETSDDDDDDDDDGDDGDSGEEGSEAEEDGDDDDDDESSAVARGVARIALDPDDAVLGAMLDETIRDRLHERAGEDQRFFDPQGPADIHIEGDEEALDLGAADRELDAMYAKEDAELAERQPKWDCESILSTTSNLDNRPNVIDDGPKRTGPKPMSRAARRAAQLKLDAIAEAERAETKARANSVASKMSCVSRKGETVEAKKARKAAIKEAQRAQRAAKKDTKLAWKEAGARAPQAHAAAPSVFTF